MRISDWSSDVCSSDLPLVEQRQGRVGQAFLKPYAGCRQRRVSAQGIEFAKVLGRDAAALVRQPVKSRSRDHVGASAIEAQRADRGKPFDQSQDVARCRRLWRSEEHTSELQSLMRTSYAVFCLKKKINTNTLK